MGSEKNPSKSGDWDGIREDIESKLGYFGQQCQGNVALFVESYFKFPSPRSVVSDPQRNPTQFRG